MKKIILLLFIFSLTACKHESFSSIEENELIKNTPLKAKEELLNAFLKKDYLGLQRLFDQSVPVDTILSGDKTLLVMGVESTDFKMVDFLINHGADPNRQITVSQGSYTAMDMAKEIDIPEFQEAMVSMLSGSIAEVNDFIYYITLEKALNNTDLDLEWLKRLLELSVEHSSLTEREFSKYYIKKAGKTNNSYMFYQMVNLHLDETLKAQWQEWTQRPFESGKYRKAKCTFFQQTHCEGFESFLDTCDDKARKKLERAKSSIEPYLQLRNATLNCQ